MDGMKRKEKTQEKEKCVILLCELSTCHYVTFAKGLFTHYVTSSTPANKKNPENKDRGVKFLIKINRKEIDKKGKRKRITN